MKTLTHKELVSFLKQFDDFKNINIHAERTAADLSSINTGEINQCIFLIANFLNKQSMSDGEIDMYKLLQKYIQNSETRKRINELIR